MSIAINIITTPNATELISIVMMFSIGLITTVLCKTFSKPKTEPYSSPKTVELTPTIPIIAARSIFLILYKRNPTIASSKPCPASPNIIPNIRMYVRATIGVGSISL